MAMKPPPWVKPGKTWVKWSEDWTVFAVTLFVGKVDFRKTHGSKKGRGSVHLPGIAVRTKSTAFEEMPAFLNGVATKEKQSCHKEGKKISSRVKRKGIQVITSLWKQCDDKKACKRTDRRPPAHCHVLQTRPHTAPYSHFHRRCAANLLHRQRVRSGGTRQPYNALHVRTCRGGRALHRACIAPAAPVVRNRVPLCLDKPTRDKFSTCNWSGRKGEEKKPVPSGISSSGENWTGLPILTTPPVSASYKKRFRWKTSTGGSASMSTVTCWLALLGPDGLTCTDLGCEMWASASWMLCIESGCRKSLGSATNAGRR
jgi:hypothetical protein